MDGCNCPVVTTEEIKTLLGSDSAEGKAQAIAGLVNLLTSRDKALRARGYELFKEGIHDALLCSCFNYAGLVGGFTHPFLTVVTDAIEYWAATLDGKAPDPGSERMSFTSPPHRSL